MFDWYKKVVFENYFNFSGRARRSEYWYFTLVNLLFAAATAATDKVLDLKFGINTLYSLAVFIPGLAVAVRRLHDIGKTGWLLLIVYLAIIACAVSLVVTGIATIGGSFSAGMGIGIILPVIIILALAVWMLVLFCTNGDKGKNKYGPDPKSDGAEAINEIGAE
ncbi:MAG: DUF805 domain-containing protein [Flavobacterium sp.]|nr:DUF805 domain-containing protein [Flavobacterium sp.]